MCIWWNTGTNSCCRARVKTRAPGNQCSSGRGVPNSDFTDAENPRSARNQPSCRHCTSIKGIKHLLAAARDFDDDVTLVLCASSPDTPEIGAETQRAVELLTSTRGPDSIIWIEEQAERDDLIQLFTHARAFVCPSVYEPLGIVNLEAMACETAVIASAVGGIPEVVVDGETGILIPYDADDASAFEAAIADAVNTLAGDPAAARRMGVAGRARAIADFGWDAIAEQTVAVYQEALER